MTLARPLGRMAPPLIKLLILAGRLFHSPKRKARAKACSSYCCEVNVLRKLAPNLTTFLKVSQKEFFRKSLTESERSDRFQPGKILKND